MPTVVCMAAAAFCMEIPGHALDPSAAATAQAAQQQPGQRDPFCVSQVVESNSVRRGDNKVLDDEGERANLEVPPCPGGHNFFCWLWVRSGGAVENGRINGILEDPVPTVFTSRRSRQ